MSSFSFILKYGGWLVSVVLLIILLSLPKCGSNNEIKSVKSDTNITYSKGKTDTVFTHIHHTHNNYIPKIVYKSIYVPINVPNDSNYINSTINCNIISVYSDTIQDSLKNVTVIVLDTIQGKIINRSSKIDFIKEKIVEVDTLKENITTTITNYKNKSPLSLGVSSGIGMTPVGIQPYVGFGINLNILGFRRLFKKD
jgi:hypothetical protein